MDKEVNNKINVSIISIVHNINYGNRLQMYALGHVIKKYSKDIKVVTEKNRKSIWYMLYKKMKYCIVGDNQLDEFWRRYWKNNLFIRELRFYKFNKKYIETMTEKRKVDCQCCIVGSDQVWNPYLFIAMTIKKIFCIGF